MTTLSSRRFGLRPILCLFAGVGVLALPGEAFGCWYKCVQAHGFTRYMYGGWWELVYCQESWPEGASGPVATCYYKRFEDFE